MADPSLYWLSFVRDGRFAGACIVVAPNEPSALTRADALGIHPGGSVAAMKVTRAGSAPGSFDTALHHLDRLFRTREEIEKVFESPTGSAGDAVRRGEDVSFVCEKHSRPS
jgi:hypothetical protein